MATKQDACSGTLLYILRRDLRISDNPILNHLAVQETKSFGQLLPMYVFAANQIEVSGFIRDPRTGNLDTETKSPYPEARSDMGNFWRCGPHRAKFLAETVWDLKTSFEAIGSGLAIRVGLLGEVVRQTTSALADSKSKVTAVWMIGEEGAEEAKEEKDVKKACETAGIEFKLWTDEKYFVDDRDLPFKDRTKLPDVFTEYRKLVEPLRQRPRPVLPAPAKGTLPSYPSNIPAQVKPFTIPSEFDSLQASLLDPLELKPLVDNAPTYPEDTESAHPFKGGETHAHNRLHHLLASGASTTYDKTRNGLAGLDFATKLSAYLSLGSITARQVHAGLLTLEDGTDDSLSSVLGYGKGENDGAKSIRFELLWRDYMRLCNRKFGNKLFKLSGFKDLPVAATKWARPSTPNNGMTADDVKEKVTRMLNGTTGMGLIDASMRELFLTGYTSNRTRQNVASFMAKHLKIDWRIGAEWFESMLVDYDLSSNWGNWQYLAGVGNDPRGDARIFNPVKQAYDYDSEGEFVRAWCPELRNPALSLGEVFQAWTVKEDKREEYCLIGLIGVEKPLLKIDFTVGKRGNNNRFHHSNYRGDSSNGGGGRGSSDSRGRGSGRWASRGGGGGGFGHQAAYNSNSYQGGKYTGRGYGSNPHPQNCSQSRGASNQAGWNRAYVQRYRGDYHGGGGGHQDYRLADMGGNSGGNGMNLELHEGQGSQGFGGGGGSGSGPAPNANAV